MVGGSLSKQDSGRLCGYPGFNSVLFLQTVLPFFPRVRFETFGVNFLSQLSGRTIIRMTDFEKWCVYRFRYHFLK